MSELLTVSEVAAVLKCSEDTVVRRFSKVRGVIDLGTAESRNKRRYRVLRIPAAVVEKHLAELGGTTVKIELPDKAERRRRSANWVNRAILNLAKAAKLNGCTDKKAMVRMAERARLLAVHVPETDWADCDWSSDLTDNEEYDSEN
jgi:hypothetical protein